MSRSQFSFCYYSKIESTWKGSSLKFSAHLSSVHFTLIHLAEQRKKWKPFDQQQQHFLHNNTSISTTTTHPLHNNISGQSYKQFTLVNYVSTVALTIKYYERKMFYRIDHITTTTTKLIIKILANSFGISMRASTSSCKTFSLINKSYLIWIWFNAKTRQLHRSFLIKRSISPSPPHAKTI